MVVVTVVAAALLVAAITLLVALRRSGIANVRDSAELRARDFVALLESGTAPGDLRIGVEEDVVVQIVSADGNVLAASPLLDLDSPVGDVAPGDAETIEAGMLGDDPFLVVAANASTGAGVVRVLVGRNLDSVVETTGVTLGILIATVPTLVVIVGVMSWLIVGRALDPVETMRREVDHISSAELSRRLPVPLARDEIARLAQTMNEMLARLESAREAQQRVASDASHELRNPIAAIRQHVENALKHPDRTDLETLAKEVLAEDLRLTRLTEDLLLLARADENALDLHREEIDIDDLLLEEARRLTATTSVTVDTSGVGAARTIGDKAGLQRALRNLIANASRHAASRVQLSSTEVGGHAIVRVQDDGPGIPEDQWDVVFERFARLDAARVRDSGGAGLGLAIVDEIVRAHGGRVTAGRADIGGAAFEIRVPTGGVSA